ncbi:hypothetical protein [Pontibacter sp. G13]|uniref:hypothetical protein n=1 Tax=Pontibacter sp. G13 TaxID=3074898 RepID=UPI00288BC0D3|nr:hypothetical protein [Pontibacter sp. G13]WNJ17542.1 hypothetical protein RJD25_22055 [Pontibacter sp. G13]
MVKQILAVIAGLIVGFLLVAAIEGVSHELYPVPEALSTMDPANPEFKEVMKEHVATMPLGAILMVGLAHLVGVFGATAVATAIAKERAKTPVGILIGLFLAFGVMNLIMIPHPIWFSILDVLIYPIGGFLGMYAAAKLIASRAQ